MAVTSGVWSELYRPHRIEDVMHQDVVKRIVGGAVASGELPNLLFYGPPGTGKTSLALALCKQLFGEKWTSRTLELNASDDRGIDVIRDRVKTWARLVSTGQNVSYKLVILDEADSMTPDAQSALRRIMEDFVKNTRFIIICNYHTKIRDAIASRCVQCRFTPIPREAQAKRLSDVVERAARQGGRAIHVSQGAVDVILDAARGDLRLAINLLQTAVATSGTDRPSANGPPANGPAATGPATEPPPCEVTEANINQLLAKPEESLVSECLENMLAQKLDDQTRMKDLEKLSKRLLTDAIDADALIEVITERLIERDDISESLKGSAIYTLGLASTRLCSGSSEYAQLMMAVSTIALLPRN